MSKRYIIGQRVNVRLDNGTYFDGIVTGLRAKHYQVTSIVKGTKYLAQARHLSPA